MALELVTYADLKKLLTLQNLTIDEYPPLDVINASMITAFEEYLGRSLDSKERTESQFIGAFGKSMLKLKAVPISSVASVTILQRGDSTTYTENDDFEITSYGLKLWMPLKNSKITVVYTGGLSGVTEESNLNRAALYQISYEFQSKDQIGAESVSNEGGSVQRPELGLLKETKRLLVSSFHPLHTGKP